MQRWLPSCDSNLKELNCLATTAPTLLDTTHTLRECRHFAGLLAIASLSRTEERQRMRPVPEAPHFLELRDWPMRVIQHTRATAQSRVAWHSFFESIPVRT